jgi:hypothetical protein
VATLNSATISPSNSTDALFRAWAKFISDSFALGWTDTVASGEINFVTVLAPTVANTAQGFKVYRMSDALQATKPVFVKIEFGSATTVNNPAIWITIGTGHDGSGGITGINFARTQITASTNSATANTDNYGSAANNRVHFAIFLTTASASIVFSLERTKDATGADTNEGLLLTYLAGAVGSGARMISQNFILHSGTQPPAQSGGLHYLTCYEANSIFGGDIGVSPLFHFKGVAAQPGLGLLATRSGDIGNFALPSIPFYGSNHTYVHLGGQLTTFMGTSGAASGAVDGSGRLMMRYE